MMIRNFLSGVALSAAVMTMAGAASAAVIGFDDVMGGNPNGSYEEDGFSFTPNSGTNGNCPVTADAPCVKELHQGEITTMTKLTPGTFDILGFDFLLVGSGNNNENQNNVSSMVLTGFDPEHMFEIKMGDALGTFTNYILTTVTGVATGVVDFNQGYRVTFLNGFFDGLTEAQFTTIGQTYETCINPNNGRPKPNCTPGWVDSGNAQARIDNIVTADVAPVPVPASGLLLAGALAGFAALRRRKAA